ncbi:GNAT family N-acetyltransferase [Draconibacterium sediminis]|uniref:N-acetyltransferase domain-containing protein n=1 Tax=Draconibacterium sediminis TaxID=1544798 RepID=A0A0D8JER7_9BACT|nr:GNAT family N-acetyltransferase [Draconibacterium sediminis]KJF45392.1 hypothetical protein LH29_08495 [Draconibacterium sediminis]
MKNELTINLTPTETDLKVIGEWLSSENKKYREGFYCNWSTIVRSYSLNRMISFNLRDKIIGFLVYSPDEISVEIDIFEIQRKYRGKGYGKIFFKQVADEFKIQKFKAVSLFCEPVESERFWRGLGFLKFPERGYSEPDLRFYKPLISFTEVTESPNELNKLELWDVEPFQKDEVPPCWSWNIENSKLLEPIIQPCNENWNLRWTQNGKIIKEGKVKRFSTTNFPVIFDSFMYIENLVE